MIHMAITPSVEEELEDSKHSMESGTVPDEIFNSESIFELEKETIFKKSWIFLAHESEIPNPGDYVLRHICDDGLIVVRDENEKVRVLSNSCRHQGMEVCRTEKGNTTHFRCPYHGWTYNNSGDLVGVPLEPQAYGQDGLEKEDWRLIEAPKYDTYKGMIFACLTPDGESLETFLGDFTFYLDSYIDRSPNGMEVRGPQRRIVDGNWKLPTINSMGDSYHVAITHHSVAEIGAFGSGDDMGADNDEGGTFSSNQRRPGYEVIAGAGALTFSPSGTAFSNYPEVLRENARQHFSENTFELFFDGNRRPTNCAFFPNTNLNNTSIVYDDGKVAPYTYLRTIRPLGPDKAEVLSWHVVEKDAPESYKERSYQAYLFSFGSSGIVEQDDVENFRGITDVVKGSLNKDLNYQIGMEQEEFEEWEHPGTARKVPLSEANARHYFAQYFDYLRSHSE